MADAPPAVAYADAGREALPVVIASLIDVRRVLRRSVEDLFAADDAGPRQTVLAARATVARASPKTPPPSRTALASLTVG